MCVRARTHVRGVRFVVRGQALNHPCPMDFFYWIDYVKWVTESVHARSVLLRHISLIPYIYTNVLVSYDIFFIFFILSFQLFEIPTFLIWPPKLWKNMTVTKNVVRFSSTYVINHYPTKVIGFITTMERCTWY